MQSPSVILAFLMMALAAPALAQDGADPGGEGVRAAAAQVRPGDQIALRFLRDPDLSESLTVNERGEAVFPKLGILTVDQMTIAQLRDTLRTRYSEFLRLPEVEISVLRRVVVNGEVRAPNVYMVDISTTLQDLIAHAGGLTDAANRNKVTIVRDGQRISAGHWYTGDAAATELRSGDQVIVGRKNWWMLNALPAVSTAVLVASLIISVSR